ncbi:hypothetical protein PV326_003018 [Microctonus aethiopoides]|nr:hypothetical protein PV326_003018 [Microctonus aethiopoides]
MAERIIAMNCKIKSSGIGLEVEIYRCASNSFRVLAWIIRHRKFRYRSRRSNRQIAGVLAGKGGDVTTGRNEEEGRIARERGDELDLKYLREVTPYFRKASIIQEVGWELQRGFLSATPPPPKSPPRADTRYLPLQLCRLTRAHPSSDPGK